MSKATIESQVSGHYEEDFIMQTLKYCKNYFKHTLVKQKAGFFLSALQEGYFKEDIIKESKKDEKKAKSIEHHKKQSQEKEKISLERNKKIEKLREEYLTDAFIEAVLLEHKDGFLHTIMEKSRKQDKTINLYLQGFIDKKLLEEF